MMRYTIWRRVTGSAIAVAALIAGSGAQARWLEARSKHFVIYSDTTETAATTFANRLELLDSALRYIQNVPERDGGDANPVTIYVAPSIAAVRRLYGGGARSNVDGFYSPRVSGSVAFTPRRGDGDEEYGLSADIVLYHEYTHHFLLGNFALAFPRWFSEGFAEYASTAKFTKDYVQVGAAAQHRAIGLFLGEPMSAERLFGADAMKLSEDQTEAVYGYGWLLTHYLIVQRGTKELNAYLTLLNHGTPSVAAAKKAFGDLKAIDRALQKYMNAPRITVLQIPLAKLTKPEITLRPLSDGEAALIPARMQSDRGVNAKTAPAVFAEGARLAAPYPKDAVAQGWLAEMAFDAGDDAAAEAACDRALAVDPQSIQALIYKGRVHLRRAAQAKGDAAAWAKGRKWIVKANHLQPNNAEALTLFYMSFREEGIEPSKSALAALHRAVELVPQDTDLRFIAARQDLLSGDVDEAKTLLRPLAYDPHAEPGNPVAGLLAALDAGTEGKAALAAFDAAVAKAIAAAATAAPKKK